MIEEADCQHIESTFKCPETVQDLISLLKTFPLHSKLSFTPFNLQSVTEDDGRVQFEMREIDGTDFKMAENLNG